MTEPVRDPQVLRALAHPVRGRILDEMSAAGSMRAADVATLLGIPANQASFHLRQLAKYGLIEEDPDAARDRRDRVWRPVSANGLTVNLGELAELPGGTAAVAAFRRGTEAWAHRVVAGAFAPAVEGEFRSFSDSPVRLTEAQARELSAELNAVLTRWGERTRGRAAEGARTYLYFATLGPYPE